MTHLYSHLVTCGSPPVTKAGSDSAAPWGHLLQECFRGMATMKNWLKMGPKTFPNSKLSSAARYNICHSFNCCWSLAPSAASEVRDSSLQAPPAPQTHSTDFCGTRSPHPDCLPLARPLLIPGPFLHHPSPHCSCFLKACEMI